MKDCCVIIPIYNKVPTDNEKISLYRNLNILTDYDIYLVHPFFMDTSEYESILAELLCNNFNKDLSPADIRNSIHFKPFKKKYFKSNKTYSRLLLSEEFYYPFMDYEYMLIAQTDTYILNTNYSLNDFISQSKDNNYDYWGAPWPNGPFFKPYTIKDRIKLLIVKNPSEIHVGNGGFSLRHIKHSYDLVHQKKNLIDFFWRFNEDMFFSYFAYDKTNKYTAASPHLASAFALETDMKEQLKNGKIPYAVHAWEKHITNDDLLNYTIG